MTNNQPNINLLSKRALQIQQEDQQIKPSFRRARAGTLPSNLSNLNPPPLPSLNLTAAGLSPAAIESLDFPSQKSGLRHSHSSAINFERSPRLRSGSLTLPPSSPSVQRLADPFGSRFFYSRTNSQVGAVGDEVKSSHDVHDNSAPEEACLRTLDYLGLDDPPSTPSSPKPNPNHLTIPQNNSFSKGVSLNSPTRSRAYTLSTSKAADPFKPTFPMTPNDNINNSSNQFPINQSLNNVQPFPSHDPLIDSFTPIQSSRPRAISMGILDEPDVIRTPARSGVPFPDNNTHQPHPLQQSFNSYDLELEDPLSVINQVQSTQVPTRSLWIGGLDPRTTAQELMHVFSPYGAIESLRLLTDKVCSKFFFHSSIE